MSEITTTIGAPAGLTPEKKQANLTVADKSNSAITWKSMSIQQKWSFLTSNITVEPMVACYVIPSVLSSLATQNLILEKACRVNLAYSDEICSALSARNTTGYEAEETAVQQLVARMQTWKTPLQSALPAILILFMGAWSDRTGLRKPCMLLPIIGEFFSSVTLIACTYWFHELPMETVVLETVWPALTGGWFTMFMGIFSYIADITSVESRTLRIGAANVFLSLGVPIGMALSGILYTKLGFYGVFTISMVCYVMSFVYGLVVIKEPPRVLAERARKKTLPNKGKRISVCAFILNFFSLRHIEETFRVAFKKGANNRQKRVIVLMVIVMVVIGPLYGEMAVLYLYMRYRYNWNEVSFSMFSTFGMVTNLIGTAISVGIFSHILKIDDAIVGIMSCMSKILASFVYAFATSAWMVYVGKVNSLFGVCESLMPLIYGPMYSAIYAATMNTLPGTFFIAGGSMTMPAVFAFLWLYTEHRKDRMLKEQKDPEAVINHKNEDTTDHSLKNIRIIDTQKVEIMNGIDNAAFESEKL
ncbi:hypothetical protein ACFW04_004171 [Cataglyphis niger]